jgi:NAD(P)-dependent dehydrogenase (short-subunit alcohol dehydrogenase family)
VTAHRADLSQAADVEALAAEVLAAHGRCDIVVNNAGIVRRALFEKIGFDDWCTVMAVNVGRMFLVCRALVPGMIERGYGRIVNIAYHTFGQPVPGFAHYMASKGAVIGLTRRLANNVGSHGVT